MSNCKYGNEKCLCQFCKSKCDKVNTCLDCLSNGKAAHEITMCTKFQRDDDELIYHYDENRNKKEFKKFWNEEEQEEQ